MWAMQQIAYYLHKKYQVRSCFKVPPSLPTHLLLFVKYHNLPAALLSVALGESKRLKWQNSLLLFTARRKCTKRLEEVAPRSQFFLRDNQESGLADFHLCWYRMLPFHSPPLTRLDALKAPSPHVNSRDS